MIREEEGAGVTRDGKLNYDDLYIYVTTWLKKTGTCLLKASNILLYYFVSIKSLLSTILMLLL